MCQTNTEVFDTNHTSSYNDYIELNADFTNGLGSLTVATDEGRSMSETDFDINVKDGIFKGSNAMISDEQSNIHTNADIIGAISGPTGTVAHGILYPERTLFNFSGSTASGAFYRHK